MSKTKKKKKKSRNNLFPANVSLNKVRIFNHTI